jgi:hypothetical protein
MVLLNKVTDLSAIYHVAGWSKRFP